MTSFYMTYLPKNSKYGIRIYIISWVPIWTQVIKIITKMGNHSKASFYVT
jgi:hypothetical protein